MTSLPRVAAIVLAAGQSTRLGRSKQLLPVDGYPLLARTLETVRRSDQEPLVLVLGAYAKEIQASIETGGFIVVVNDQFAAGQAGSLRAGLDALPCDVDGVVVFLGDQPFVSPMLVKSLVAAFEPGVHIAVQPRYTSGPGNPVLLSASIFPELAQLTGDVGARDILRQHQDQIDYVDAGQRPAPRDVDTFEDYLAFMDDWASLGGPDIPEFCLRCGTSIGFELMHDRLRPVCPVCNFTYFYDPKIAVAVIVEISGQIVMQKRAIDPGRGKWTFPSGFVDRGEAIRDAAIREVSEETGIRLSNLALQDIYSSAGETVDLVVFTANADGQTPVVGDESTDVRLFNPDQLPELAFPRDRRVIADWSAAQVSNSCDT